MKQPEMAAVLKVQSSDLPHTIVYYWNVKSFISLCGAVNSFCRRTAIRYLHDKHHILLGIAAHDSRLRLFKESQSQSAALSKCHYFFPHFIFVRRLWQIAMVLVTYWSYHRTTAITLLPCRKAYNGPIWTISL